MNMSEIQQAIAAGNFSQTELQKLGEFVQGVRVRQTKQSIRVGDDVVVVQKTKRTPGVVKDIKIKRAVVAMRGSLYNVPLSMIEPA